MGYITNLSLLGKVHKHKLEAISVKVNYIGLCCWKYKIVYVLFITVWKDYMKCYVLTRLMHRYLGFW